MFKTNYVLYSLKFIGKKNVLNVIVTQYSDYPVGDACLNHYYLALMTSLRVCLCVQVWLKGSLNLYWLTRLRTYFNNIKYNSKGLKYKTKRFASITENNNFEKVHSIWNLRLKNKILYTLICSQTLSVVLWIVNLVSYRAFILCSINSVRFYQVHYRGQPSHANVTKP